MAEQDPAVDAVRGQNPSRAAAKDESQADNAVESVIAEHPFLSGLRPAHLKLLADEAMRMHYEAGEFIFREGDPANRFYLLEQGKVVLEARPRDGPAVRVQVLGAGDVLGWSWLFPPYAWQFEARAVEPTTAIFLYGTRLREHCEADPEFGHALLKRMTGVAIQRLQAARRQLLSAHR